MIKRAFITEAAYANTPPPSLLPRPLHLFSCAGDQTAILTGTDMVLMPLDVDMIDLPTLHNEEDKELQSFRMHSGST